MLQEPVTWHGMLREFLARCLLAWPGEQADCLREASLLFQFARSTPPQPVAPGLERLIAAGAYTNAAITLLGSDARHTLARAADGAALAHVTLACGAAASATARVPALALLTANARALLQQVGCQDIDAPPARGPVRSSWRPDEGVRGPVPEPVQPRRNTV